MSLDLESLESAFGGRYRLESELGSGGMSAVYMAWDAEESRQVALKVLLPELASAVGAERFLREIRIGVQLNHPHILPLYGSGQAGELLYYTMPVVEGETLRARLDREGQLPIEESLEIACQVASALAYAHKHDVVHRDIKPENILLSEGGAVVTDFGIAHAIDRAGGERLTETGLAMGTPAYMSPEQAEGKERLDERSDQYSLACVLYEMLAGHPPFGGPTSRIVLNRAAKDPVPSLSSARQTVSVPVEAVIHKALSKVAADRFVDAEAFAKALELAEEGVTPRGVTPSGVTPWEVRPSVTFWTELARRRVYQVAASYLVVAWALVQVADATFESLGIPVAVQQWLVWGAIGGFPIALLLAWLYELTPRGIQRTQAVDVTPVSGTRCPGRPRLGLTAAVAAVGIAGVTSYLAGRASGTSGPLTEITPFPRGVGFHTTAVVPFRVSGNLEQYRTALVDLLLPRFNELEVGLEAAEIRRAWREIAGADTAEVDEYTARLIARNVNARWAVHGSLVETHPGLTLTARRIWVETGKAYGDATIQASLDELNRALAMLPARLVGGAPQRVLDETPTEAIEAYNAGIRAGTDYAQAIPHFERAIQIDSTFGSAAYWLFYAHQNSGRRGAAKERARELAWALRDRTSAAESLYMVGDGNFGPNGPAGRPYSRDELWTTAEQLVKDGDAPWPVWQVYAARVSTSGDPNWRKRWFNAWNHAIEGMPPSHHVAPAMLGMRYRAALEWPGEWADSARQWGRQWAYGYHHTPEQALVAEWVYSEHWEEWDALRALLPEIGRYDMLAGATNEPRIVDRFVDVSAERGIPPDLGAEQAVDAAAERVRTETDHLVAVHARARLALLKGRLREAASGYRELAAIGDTSARWMSRWLGAYAALTDPGFRSAAEQAGIDFSEPFYVMPDTSAVPKFVENWDNPWDRLCTRDLWETIVLGRYDRPSKTAARLDTQIWSLERDPTETALVQYEQGNCATIVRAVVAEALSKGDSPTDELLALESYEPSNSAGWKRVSLFAARMLSEHGLYDRALEALGPFPELVDSPHFVDFAPIVVPYLALEGQLAAKTGDPERAIRAFEHYLTLRSDPDELARPEVAEVCAGLGEVADYSPTDRFPACR